MADNMLTEIQDDFNHERMMQFFARYGKYLYTLAFLVVIGAGAFEAWKYYDLKQRSRAGDKLYSIISNFDAQSDVTKLQEVAKNHAYKDVTGLIEANLYEKQKNTAEMEKAYANVAANSSNPALKQIAALNIISLKLNRNPADSSVEKDLIALTADDAVFKFTALEMLGSYYKKNGKNAESKAAYSKIANDAAAPASISGRAKSMLSSF